MSQPTIIINNEGNRGNSGSILGSLFPSRVWVILGIAVLIIGIISLYSAYSTYSEFVEQNCPDASSLLDVGFCAVEDNTGLEDTGSGITGSFLSIAFWASPAGLIGSAIGIRTDGGNVGDRIGNNYDRIKNSTFTLFKRLIGR